MDTESKFDLVIVGAGPAGLSAALNAHKNGLKYVLLEKADHIADTIFCYQKGKFVMAEPTVIPLRGELFMEATIREDLLGRWDEAVRKDPINLVLNAPVAEIAKSEEFFVVRTDKQSFEAKHVIIAIGTQGNPRKLGAPGEYLPHVLTRLVDPDMYRDKDILVVGGGDSAVEVAVALAANNRVTMSVRSKEFLRTKARLERQALDAVNKGAMTILFESAIESVDPKTVTIKLPKSTVRVQAQVVIAKIGTLSPRAFLEKCGVEFSSREASATPVLSSSYEANVPGLFLIGAVTGKPDLIKNAINQGYEVVEHICGREVEPADEQRLKEILHFMPGRVSDCIQALLSKAPVLGTATEPQIRELLLFSQFHRFSPGQVVFQQNDYSESLYIVLEGNLEISANIDGGGRRTVTTREQGEFVGEMSLISGRRRSATVTATTQSLLWEIGRKAMLKLIHTTESVKQLVDKAFLIRAFQTYLLPNLDYFLLKKLSDKAKVLSFEKGKTIIKEGDPGDAFYFVRSGMVKLSKLRDGRDVVLAYRSAGQYFGEIALLRDEPRMATATAIDKVEVIQVLKQDFLTLLDSAGEFKKQILMEMDRRRVRTVEADIRPELAQLQNFMTGEEVVVSDNALLIDESRCIHCDNCVKACESVHEDGQTRLKRTGIKFANILVANSCRHCENPLCMTDCPPGDAIVRDPQGEVYIRDNCIACGNCAANCPYDNIFMVHPKEKWSLWDTIKDAIGLDTPKKESSAKSIPVKCDLCRGLEGGPACVQSCPTGAVLRLTAEEYYQKVESLVAERKDII